MRGMIDIIAAISTATDFSSFTSAELVEALAIFDDAYFNEDELISDVQYDAIKRYLSLTDPNNDYLQLVGSDVRGGKVDLPHSMGSLNQSFTQADLNAFKAKHKLHGKKVVLTDKEDGYSGSMFYNNIGNIRIGYSRGNGFKGADITRHLKRFKSVPQHISVPNLEIRVEVIISPENFKKLAAMGVTSASTGKPYKNPRNMVSGLMNSSEIDDKVVPYIDVIAYHIWSDNEQPTKTDELIWLSSLGFQVAPYCTGLAEDLLDESVLIPYLNQQRAASPFEIDGIVVEIDDKQIRENITPSKSKALNPGYSFKYKVASADNIASPIVKYVQWNLSKHNYAKPTVWFDPVELMGVTVKKATGFNAAFIINNGIGPGAKVNITRAGDVIPYILGVVEPNFTFDHEEDIIEQFGEFTWSINDKKEQIDIVIKEQSETAAMGKAVEFFTKLGVDNLKEGNIRNLFNCGFNSTAAIIKVTKEDLNFAVGQADAAIIYPSLRKALDNVSIVNLMGASSLMGRGLGVRKMQKIYDVIGEAIIDADYDTIRRIDTFEHKSAVKFVTNLPVFKAFYEDIKDYITVTKPKVVTEGTLVGANVIFTGFRNKQLEERFKDAGAKIAGSVSKNVTHVIAADPDENTGKVQKARLLGITIISLADVEDLF